MVHETYLKRSNTSWRPAYVRNMSNFASTIENYRASYMKAPEGSAEERQVVANFNKAYTAWINKVKAENVKRRATERAFFTNLTAARKTGNSTAVKAVLSKYNTSVKRQSPPRAAAPLPRARSASPKRSGKKRNSGNLRKMMARRNLSRVRANLMAQKAELENERNKIETKIFTLIRQIGELPY